MRGFFTNFDKQVRFRTEIYVCFPRHTAIFGQLSDDSGGTAQRLEGGVSQLMFGLI